MASTRCNVQAIELLPGNKFILRGEDYTVCSRSGICVIKLQPSFGGQYWILGDVFMEVRREETDRIADTPGGVCCWDPG